MPRKGDGQWRTPSPSQNAGERTPMMVVRSGESDGVIVETAVAGDSALDDFALSPRRPPRSGATTRNPLHSTPLSRDSSRHGSPSQLSRGRSAVEKKVRPRSPRPRLRPSPQLAGPVPKLHLDLEPERGRGRGPGPNPAPKLELEPQSHLVTPNRPSGRTDRGQTMVGCHRARALRPLS